ncbi:MAG: GFA family protein [Myxococcota bacterium]|nr:GFA family protein [Myxococcota bacterium]
MVNAKVHTGGCHCGKVRYEVTIDLSAPVISCNCSMCKKKGTLLSFVPTENFKLRQGEDALTKYQFNKKVIDHLFCSTCGVTSFARGKKPDGTAMVAINTRCLDGVEPNDLQVKHFDGAGER